MRNPNSSTRAGYRLTTGATAGFVGFDTERTPVRPHRRGFSKVRVVTRGRDITLDFVELTFGDGTTQKFNANRVKVEPNVGWGPVEIDGGPKVIREVVGRYRSRFFDRRSLGRRSRHGRGVGQALT